jgi:hypothetical protein
MLALLLRAPTRNAQGNKAEAEQGEHAGLGDSHEEILERHSISDRAINGGVGPVGDPIAFETAWLYTQFINHTLFGYTYGDNSSANALQDAIWYFEGEGGSYNAFAQLADAANPIDIGNVRVLNLKNASGGNAQDVLIVVTPEPLSLLLLGAGLIGLAGLRRKE